MRDIIAAKVERGERIEVSEAAWLHEHGDDALLRDLASSVRARFHAPDEATYLVMAIVNYTNVCVARCDYCAFYRLPGAKDTYLLSFDALCERIDDLRQLGGSLIGFNGGFHPKLRLDDYAGLFARVRERYPDVELYEMTVAEFMYYCKVGRVPYDEGARMLADAGTRWVTGGGAEILDDAFRERHSPLKYTVEDYFDAQRAIVANGLGSTATMVIGFDETLHERLNHLKRLRQFQDAVGGALPSFLCWTYKPWNNDLGGAEASTAEYLRWLAISRIFLDNFVHIRTSVLTKNEDALLGLRYGADDFDLPTEDEVTTKAGATISHEFDRILQTARDLGITPRLRAPWPVPQIGVAA